MSLQTSPFSSRPSDVYSFGRAPFLRGLDVSTPSRTLARREPISRDLDLRIQNLISANFHLHAFVDILSKYTPSFPKSRDQLLEFFVQKMNKYSKELTSLGEDHKVRPINALEEIAADDSPQAAYLLGIFYSIDFGLKANAKRSKDMFVRSARLNYIQATYQLGFHLPDPSNPSETLKYRAIAIKAGYVPALLTDSTQILFGSIDPSVSPTKEHRLIRLLIESGEDGFIVPVTAEWSALTVNVVKQAIKQLEWAAKQDSAAALFLLAMCKWYGIGYRDRNCKEAITLLHQAADKEQIPSSVSALRVLAACHERGFVIPKNPQFATALRQQLDLFCSRLPKLEVIEEDSIEEPKAQNEAKESKEEKSPPTNA